MQHDSLPGGINKSTVLIGQQTVMSLVAMLMLDLIGFVSYFTV